MDKKKETAKATRELKKELDKGIPELSSKMVLTVCALCELKDTLAEYEKYKVLGIDSQIKKYEAKLKTFEGLIDKKYWDDFSLFYLIMAIGCRQADNLDKAVIMLEKFNKE